MAVDLSPNQASSIFAGDGGSYGSWSHFGIIADAKLGAGILTLKPQGFAFPHGADSSKVGYVLTGKAIVGVILPEDPKEKIVLLSRGDAIVFPLGNVSWWYNGEDEDFSIVFLGDTSDALKPGDFTYFFLAGSLSVFNAFSKEFLARASGVGEEEVEKLFRNQPGVLLIKLEEKLQDFKTSKGDREGLVLNIEQAPIDIDVKFAGLAKSITAETLSLLRRLRFSINILKLDPNAMLSPGFFPDASVQLIYVTKGSGHVQLSGANGTNALDAEAKEGDLFLVPKFSVFSVIAGSEGLEWFSIITSSKSHFRQMIGKKSLFTTLAPKIIGVALNADPELLNILSTQGNKKDVLIAPPSN